MTLEAARSREERLEHNLRGLIAAHAGLKRKHGEPVDERLLLQLVEPKEEKGCDTANATSVGDEVALGWGARVLRVRGVVMLVVVGLFAALAALLWINYQGFQALAADHKKVDEWMESVVYVLTLSDVERRGLKLRTPDKIRDLERAR